MSEQAKEWDDMNEQTQSEIKARLCDAIKDVDRAALRQRLAHYSRSGLPAGFTLNEI